MSRRTPFTNVSNLLVLNFGKDESRLERCIKYLNKKSQYLKLMNKELIMIGATLLMLVLTTSTNNLSAQNATTNASNAAGNMTASANQTASELGQNASLVLNKAGEKVGSSLHELGQNMSHVGSKLGQNLSDVGSEILNKSEQTAKKVGIGAADVLSNISGEIKEGLSGK
jgi:cell division septum initiation protein DivIVA